MLKAGLTLYIDTTSSWTTTARLGSYFTAPSPTSAVYTIDHRTKLGCLHLLSVHLLRHHLVHHHHLHCVTHDVTVVSVVVVGLGSRDVLDLDLRSLLFLDLDLDRLALTTTSGLLNTNVTLLTLEVPF